jgi:Ca2+-binding EF-hand superfamily protein
MLMSFMLLDFDNDGLISHSDLFKLLTMLDKNLLVKRTIYTILKYVKENANNQAIRDVCY